MTDDRTLLRQYAREHSEPAFGELVRRHIDLVYAAALRVACGDCHLAEDVTQTVFLDLARKAPVLPDDVVLPGWLYRHTGYTAAKAVRTERRRKIREQLAMEMGDLDSPSETPWKHIAPHLEECLNQLKAADRDAIVLRFLKQQESHRMASWPGFMVLRTVIRKLSRRTTISRLGKRSISSRRHHPVNSENMVLSKMRLALMWSK